MDPFFEFIAGYGALFTLYLFAAFRFKGAFPVRPVLFNPTTFNFEPLKLLVNPSRVTTREKVILKSVYIKHS